MNGIDQAALWWPDYPKARDKRVELDDCELETMISNRQPTITVTGEPLDAPACFWTDPDHIYLRGRAPRRALLPHQSFLGQ